MFRVKSLVLYLVSLLGHDDFAVREGAQTTLCLLHLGVDVSPSLSVLTTDPEVRRRLQELRACCPPWEDCDLIRYRWHVTDATPLNLACSFSFLPGGKVILWYGDRPLEDSGRAYRWKVGGSGWLIVEKVQGPTKSLFYWELRRGTAGKSYHYVQTGDCWLIRGKKVR